MTWELFFSAVLVLAVSIANSYGQGQTEVGSPVNALKVEDLEVGGWRMVFKGNSGNGDSVHRAWLLGSQTSSTKPQTMENSHGEHYRDSIVKDWSKLGVKLVKYAFYDRDAEVAHVIFDGRGSNIKTWFSKSRVLSSSWPGLTSTASYNYFSIDGHYISSRHDRRFFINQIYKGCPNDVGYMVVINSKTPAVCHWDSHPAYPQFLYSRYTSGDLWDRRMFGIAGSMAIFIKTN